MKIDWNFPVVNTLNIIKAKANNAVNRYFSKRIDIFFKDKYYYVYLDPALYGKHILLIVAQNTNHGPQVFLYMRINTFISIQPKLFNKMLAKLPACIGVYLSLTNKVLIPGLYFTMPFSFKPSNLFKYYYVASDNPITDEQIAESVASINNGAAIYHEDRNEGSPSRPTFH
jgi:hypothetical protein